MNLSNIKFTEIDSPEVSPGLSRKYWEGDYNLEDFIIPLELVLTEYAGDVKHDKYFSIDIKQRDTHHGDEFSSIEEALMDAENRILELFEGDVISEFDQGYDDKSEMY